MRISRLIVPLCCGLGLAVMLSACGREARAAKSGTGTTLMLIDLQRDYLAANGRLPVAQNQIDPLIRNVNAMIAAAAQQAIPVIYTQNEFSPFDFIGNWMRNGAAGRDWPGQTFDPRINDVAGLYFTKDSPDAFSNPHVEQHLDVLASGRLVIAGVYADHSVLRTALAALANGYKVTVISDAIAGASDEARDAALQQLKAAGVETQTSAEFIAAPGGSEPAKSS